MADSTFSFLGGLVDIAAGHPQSGGIMAGVAEIGSFLDQAEHPHDTVRFMTGLAILVIEGAVFGVALEFFFRVAIDTIAFGGKSFPLLYLSIGSGIQTQKK